jgi:hypothetical protein
MNGQKNNSSDREKDKRSNGNKPKKNLSHSDKSLNTDYRPTRYGSTDVDRNKKKISEEEEKK